MISTQIFLTLFITLHLTKADQVSFSESQLSNILQNPTNCDLQIFHDGSDILIPNIPVKVMWVPKYLDTDLKNFSSPAINVMLSRTGQYKFSFLLPKEPPSAFFFSERLDTWIEISVTNHTYNVLRNTEKRYIHVDNIFVVLISMRIKEEWRDKRRNLMPGLHNTYVFIFMYLAKDKKTLESCGILQSTVRSNIWSNCRNIVDWKERMTTVASWQDKWRFAKSLWYKWLNAEFSSAKNPFDRSEIYTINNLAHIVFSRMNMTIAYTGTSSYKYDGPELQFDYKLGSTVVFESGPLGLPLITRNTGYQYLTCYRERHISFEIYLAPFKPLLWLTLLITLLLMIILTLVYQHYGAKSSFSGWIFILATIFEETGHVPNKIARLTPFRLTFGLWCLMSVVLTNCYNGLMISDLNAPLPSFKARTFNDLVCNKVPRSETDKHIEGKGIAGPYRNSFAELFFYIYGIYNGKFDERNNSYKQENCFGIYSVPLDVEWHKLNYIIRSPEFLFFLYDQVFRQGLKMWEGPFLKKRFNLL